MKFGTFYEHQLPRPWKEGAELKLFQDALDQVELADRLGIDYIWEVEHHFLEEYAHSSARSEEHTSELQSLAYLVCRLLLEKKKQYKREIQSESKRMRSTAQTKST